MKALSLAEYRVLSLWLRGYSYVDIAKAEGYSPNTASRRAKRARHKMAELMGYAGNLEEVWAMDNAEEVLRAANKLRVTTMLQTAADKRSYTAMKKRVEKRRARQDI